MHELSVAQEIINIVRQSIPSENHKVKVVRMKVGGLSGILVDSLKFCFDSLVANSDLDGSVLDILEVPIKIYCNECSKEYIINEPIFICPNCNSFNVNLLEGKELEITEIELED
jgi:hydrogenase nickel incorporation protein HypA/HybF